MARRRFDYTRNDDPGETAHQHGFISNGKTYTRELHWEIANWCEERFGPPDIYYRARWCISCLERIAWASSSSWKRMRHSNSA